MHATFNFLAFGNHDSQYCEPRKLDVLESTPIGPCLFPRSEITFAHIFHILVVTLMWSVNLLGREPLFPRKSKRIHLDELQSFLD